MKHEPSGGEWVLKRLRSLARERPWVQNDEGVQRAISNFASQSGAGRINYAARVEADEPSASVVAEAACKPIVKQRLFSSGIKRKEEGAAVVLSPRCLTHTRER